MSAKKKTTTAAPAAKKAPAKKAPAKKAPAAKKTAAAKAPAKKTAAQKKAVVRPAVTRADLSPEERYQLIQKEAYFLAEKNGFIGDSSVYWSRAETKIDQQYS